MEMAECWKTHWQNGNFATPHVSTDGIEVSVVTNLANLQLTLNLWNLSTSSLQRFLSVFRSNLLPQMLKQKEVSTSSATALMSFSSAANWRGFSFAVLDELLSYEQESAPMNGHGGICIPTAQHSNQCTVLFDMMPTDNKFLHGVWMIMLSNFTQIGWTSCFHLPIWLLAAMDKELITLILF